MGCCYVYAYEYEYDVIPDHFKNIVMEMIPESNKKFECVICLNNIKDDIKITDCGHIFHNKCLYEWVKIKNKCPTCRICFD